MDQRQRRHGLVAEGVGIQGTPLCFTESLGAVGVDGAERLALSHTIPHLDLQYDPHSMIQRVSLFRSTSAELRCRAITPLSLQTSTKRSIGAHLRVKRKAARLGFEFVANTP